MSDLQTFISTLDASGELHRITAPVSPILEITEIADRLALSVIIEVYEGAQLDCLVDLPPRVGHSV